jgi:hypothetical protein
MQPPWAWVIRIPWFSSPLRGIDKARQTPAGGPEHYAAALAVMPKQPNGTPGKKLPPPSVKIRGRERRPKTQQADGAEARSRPRPVPAQAVLTTPRHAMA